MIIIDYKYEMITATCRIDGLYIRDSQTFQELYVCRVEFTYFPTVSLYSNKSLRFIAIVIKYEDLSITFTITDHSACAFYII
jgi:hypothetical protein